MVTIEKTSNLRYSLFPLHLSCSLCPSLIEGITSRKDNTHTSLCFVVHTALSPSEVSLCKQCYKTSPAVNSVREREREFAPRGWNCETAREARRTHHGEDLKRSGQADNYATCPEEERRTDRDI